MAYETMEARLWRAIELKARIDETDPLTAVLWAQVIGASWGLSGEEWLLRELARWERQHSLVH